MKWDEEQTYKDPSYTRDSFLQGLVLRRVKVMQGLFIAMFCSFFIAVLFGFLHNLTILAVAMVLFVILLVAGLALMLSVQSARKCRQCGQRMRKEVDANRLFQLCDSCKVYFYTYGRSGGATPV